MKYLTGLVAALAFAAPFGSVFVVAQQPAPAAPAAAGGRQGAPAQPMSFFVSSVGKGDGANYGGLAGADAHCQSLAQAAGRGNVRWVAYLSTQGTGAVNARDRIGNGPWYGARGAIIAADQNELHGDTIEAARLGNRLNKVNALNERGERVAGNGDAPLVNVHDILTGSQPDGRAYTDAADHTCGNYTSNAEGRGSVQVGHHDKTGGPNGSWNSAHGSRGCSQPNLVQTGGGGLLYCFAPGN
jgi:hypothetical protein